MPPAKRTTAPQSEAPETSPETAPTSALEEASPETATASALDEQEPQAAPAAEPIPTPADTLPADPAPSDLATSASTDTMEVVMKVQISGTRNGEEWPQPGQRASLPKEEAAALIANGMAKLPATPAIETAVAFAAPETATVTGKDSIKAQESAD